MPSSDDSFDYVLYVDEAGDDGLKRLKPEYPTGSSEWMVLAGYLVRAEVANEMPGLLREIRGALGARQGNGLHYKDLSPVKRLRSCELLARQPARAFAVCSYKRSLIGYSNNRAAKASYNPQWYYNFLIRILLERVTDFCFDDAMRKFGAPRLMKIVFSNKGGHRYGRTKAYIQQLRHQAVAGTTHLATRVIRPEVLRQHLIDYVPHYLDAGLQLADIVASAAFQAVETHPRWDTGPAKALNPIFAKDPAGTTDQPRPAWYGFTLLPSPKNCTLTPEQQQIFRFYGYRF